MANTKCPVCGKEVSSSIVRKLDGVSYCSNACMAKELVPKIRKGHAHSRKLKEARERKREEREAFTQEDLFSKDN